MSEWQETEFGQIPSEWGLSPIIKLKSDVKYAIAMGPFGSNIKAENFTTSGVPVIRGTNLNNYKYVGGEFVYLTEEKANQLIGSNCKSGDLVFTHRGTIGQVGLIPDGEYSRYVISQSGMKLTPDESKITSNFLFYFFISKYGQYQLLKYESQVGVPSISNPLTSLKAIEIPVPPLKEQKAITAVLSSLDDKIDLLHRQNKTLESLAQTLFRHWFIDDDYESTISDVVQIQSGYAFKSKDFQDSGTNGVLKIKNISGGVIDVINTDYIGMKIAQNTDDKFRVVSGDILFGMTGAKIGKMGIVPEMDKDLWLNQRVALLKSKYEGSKYLAYLQLTSEFGLDYIESAATGSAQPNISATGIKDCEFPKLSERQIVDYSNTLSPIYDKIIFNLGQIQTLEKLRDTLLPKLMSGEVRVRQN